MMMLVDVGRPSGKKRLLWELLFLAITLGPWVVMIWLLWPRR